ncbi:hypothetical protein GH714_027235 [Hevea brasiliensis]|uniref:Uncharacterized protein n=1 Tax=Hevea brasiliensis TaxID=3981 RepID=A0A6A6N2L7_HEVBR|nr:hypothetical protein GH714_027235 [Hevea brasiliensis]
MGVMETTPTALALLVLRNLVAPAFIYADKSLVNLGEKYKLLEFIRYLFRTGFLFFLRLLPSFLASFNPIPDHNHLLKSPKTETYAVLTRRSGGADSGIARALIQILSLINDIPVSSRKYEVIRSLAEKIIEENQSGDAEALRLVNRTSLSAAFERTLSQLEASMLELGYEPDVNWQVQNQLNRVLRAVRSLKDGTLGAFGGRTREGMERLEEKLAAELLWLSQKLAACGCGEEAVCRWASASNLAYFALSAEPRLQGSLLKIAACNGTDVPVLSTSERAELEKILEELIETLDQEEELEQVLSLWLQHFTYSPSSDWPNLQPAYDRWCTNARKLLILQ